MMGRGSERGESDTEIHRLKQRQKKKNQHLSKPHRERIMDTDTLSFLRSRRLSPAPALELIM